MSDERLFREAMAALEVAPLDGPAPRPRKKEPSASQKERAERERRKRAARHVHAASATPPARGDQEDELFLEVMRRLDATPDKDRARRAASPAALTRIERLKPAKKPVEVESELDLHGLTVERGLETLAQFLTSASLGGKKAVLVVTGKGLRSTHGRAVLKEAVERWLYRDGQRFVRAFSEAPRAQGGRGAFVLLLR